MESGHGAEIDAYDVVIRMNCGLPTNPEDQGRRTDILAFSTLAVVKAVFRRFHAGEHIWMSPKLRADIGQFAEVPENLSFYDIDRWEALEARLGARPSVGAMVLDLVSSFNPAAVGVFGYDFKRTLTWYEPKQHIGPHSYEAEERFCEELAGAHGWLLVRDYAPPCETAGAEPD